MPFPNPKSVDDYELCSELFELSQEIGGAVVIDGDATLIEELLYLFAKDQLFVNPLGGVDHETEVCPSDSPIRIPHPA